MGVSEFAQLSPNGFMIACRTEKQRKGKIKIEMGIKIVVTKMFQRKSFCCLSTTKIYIGSHGSNYGARL